MIVLRDLKAVWVASEVGQQIFPMEQKLKGDESSP